MAVLDGWEWDAESRELEVMVREDGLYGLESTLIIPGDDLETALGVADIRARLERVTAERDARELELREALDQRDQARKEVAAMEAACVEIFADDYVVVIGSKADIEALTRSRVLGALKKARGE